MSRLDRPVDIIVEELDLEGIDLDADPEAFAALVRDDLGRLIAERGLPPRAGRSGGEHARDELGDAALARDVAEAVWRHLVVPAAEPGSPA